VGGRDRLGVDPAGVLHGAHGCRRCETNDSHGPCDERFIHSLCVYRRRRRQSDLAACCAKSLASYESTT